MNPAVAKGDAGISNSRDFRISAQSAVCHERHSTQVAVGVGVENAHSDA